MAKIIISYRRLDSDVFAGRVRDRIATRYGEDSVFIDVDNIPFGKDFRVHIQQALAEADAVLVVVGSKWLGTAKGGHSRIKDDTDPVRIEVETALAKSIPTIPILVGKTTMPKPDQLPESLRNFAFINAAPVDTGRDFHRDLDRVIAAINGILKLPMEAEDRTAPSSILAAEPEQAAVATPTMDEGLLQREEAEAARSAERERQDREAEARRRAEEEQQEAEIERRAREADARQRAEAIARSKREAEEQQRAQDERRRREADAQRKMDEERQAEIERRAREADARQRAEAIARSKKEAEEQQQAKEERSRREAGDAKRRADEQEGRRQQAERGVRKTRSTGVVAAAQSGLRNYATFSGRASRSQYWSWVLFLCVAYIAGLVIDGAVGARDRPFTSVIVLALLLPTVAISMRRLHDRDRRGWWLLISLTGIGVIVLIPWFCSKGTPGTNRFGPDSLGAEINPPS